MVRACGDAVRAGWIARQAIVSEGAGARAGLMPGDAAIRQPGFQIHGEPRRASSPLAFRHRAGRIKWLGRQGGCIDQTRDLIIYY